MSGFKRHKTPETSLTQGNSQASITRGPSEELAAAWGPKSPEAPSDRTAEAIVRDLGEQVLTRMPLGLGEKNDYPLGSRENPINAGYNSQNGLPAARVRLGAPEAPAESEDTV